MSENIFDIDNIDDLNEDQKNLVLSSGRKNHSSNRDLILDIFEMAKELNMEWLSYESVMVALLRHPDTKEKSWKRTVVKTTISSLKQRGLLKSRNMDLPSGFSGKPRQEYSLI